MTKRAARRPIVEHRASTDCPHDRQVRWTATEFACLDCQEAFQETPHGLVPIADAATEPPNPRTAPMTFLGLSDKALSALRHGHLVTVQDVFDHRDQLFHIRNVGTALADEIKAALAQWEAKYGEP